MDSGLIGKTLYHTASDAMAEAGVGLLFAISTVLTE